MLDRIPHRYPSGSIGVLANNGSPSSGRCWQVGSGLALPDARTILDQCIRQVIGGLNKMQRSSKGIGPVEDMICLFWAFGRRNTPENLFHSGLAMQFSDCA